MRRADDDGTADDDGDGDSMRPADTHWLRGPNRFLGRPVAVTRVDLGAFTGRESTDLDGFAERLLEALPGLAEHHCAAGRPGGFLDRLRGGTYLGHVTEHATIELSVLIGRQVSFGRTVYAGTPGSYDLVVECPVDEPADSALPGRLVGLAARIVQDAVEGTVGDHTAVLDRLRRQYRMEAPGPSTAALIAAARRRDIPVERIDDTSLLRLGHGVHRRMVWAAMTDRTSAIGVDLAGDKQLTRRLLAQAGVPVPAGGAARDVESAVELFEELGAPVVVKPREGRQGHHVHLELRSAEAVRAAYAAATRAGEVVVERQLPGRDYRVLVVDGAVVAAAERIAAHVVGDGRQSVEQLVAEVNRDGRRGEGHCGPLTRLALDDIALAVLRRQGHTSASVPAAGAAVWLRDNANLSTGGTSRDVTDLVHPDVAAMCRRTAAIVGLDVAGIDLRLADIAAPVPPTGAAADVTGGVIEVNAVPGLRMHLSPSEGRPRDVAESIVDTLYPPGRPARVPIVAVTGTNGKTTTTRLTAHLLAATGLRIGFTTTDGVTIDGRLVQRADATGPWSAQLLLGDPAVELAVLETARGGILRRGLGYDRSDVGVITNISTDHLGQDGLETLDDLVDVKAIVAEQVRDGGTIVLNADDERVVGLVQRPRVRAAHKRLVWFGRSPDNPVLRRHTANGGTAFVLDDGWLVERSGARRVALMPAVDLPGSFGGLAPHAISNALAAAAAARALDVPAPTVAERLKTFAPETANPGRGMLLRRDDVHVVVDYAHNAAAIRAMTEPLHRVWGPGNVVAAVTLPGDRHDDLVVDCAHAVADAADRVVLYEDRDLRGRARGEMRALLAAGIRDRRPAARLRAATGPRDAVGTALGLARPGDVVLVLYEKVEPVVHALARLGAVPCTDAVADAAGRRLRVRQTQ